MSVIVIFDIMTIIIIMRKLYAIYAIKFDRPLSSFFLFNAGMIVQLAIFKPEEKKRIWAVCDGELAVPSVGGQFSVSVFTPDYKGGVCSRDAQTSLEAASDPGQHTGQAGNMALTGCTKCIKYMLFFFNFIFWVS